MKKLTAKQLRHGLRQRDDRNVRRLIHKDKLRHYRTYSDWPSKRPGQQRRTIKIPLPRKISLESQHDGLMDCIHKIRDHGVMEKNPLYVDFSNVRHVGPCGALLIAAELDRYKTICNFRQRVRHKSWHPDVLRLMDEMGLFEILDVANPPKFKKENKGNLSFFRFRSSSKIVASHADLLADEIEKIAGQIPERRKMYRGISEAMSNVANHAYPDSYNYEIPVLKNKWWMAGSFNHKTRHLTVMVYDQGVGIPYTLPREHTMEKVSGLLDLFKLKDDDASRIKISMELGKTQTKTSHRGKGLFRDIRPYTEDIPDGCLRVLSGRGEYIYAPQEADPKKQERLITHSKSLGGTLILWEGTLSR